MERHVGTLILISARQDRWPDSETITASPTAKETLNFRPNLAAARAMHCDAFTLALPAGTSARDIALATTCPGTASLVQRTRLILPSRALVPIAFPSVSHVFCYHIRRRPSPSAHAASRCCDLYQLMSAICLRCASSWVGVASGPRSS